MKSIVLLISIALTINLSQQMVQLIKCPEGFVPLKNPKEICARVTCISDQKLDMVRCPEVKCPEGKQTDFKEEDNSKIYPDCCGGPVCEN